MENLEKTREQVIDEELDQLFGFVLSKSYKRSTTNHERLYKTPRDLARSMMQYLKPRLLHDRPISIRGYLNRSKFVTPRTYYNYREYGEDYSKLIDLFSGIVEEYNIDALYDSRHNGARFALQCGFNNWIPKEHQIIENKDIIINIGSKSKNNGNGDLGTNISESEDRDKLLQTPPVD